MEICVSIFHRRSVEIREFTSASLDLPGKKQAQMVSNSKFPSVMSFTGRRLTLALAKTILSSGPTNLNLLRHLALANQKLQIIIDPQGPSLSLVPEYRALYRDITATTNTCELAQALTYLFATDVLGYAYVDDFIGFMSAYNAAPTAKKSRPDFIAYGKRRPGCVLIDSKGTCPASDRNHPKTDLKKAINQCKTGSKELNKSGIGWTPSATYGVQIRAAQINDSWPTVLNVADPENEPSQSFDIPLSIFRYHYASWFLLAGRIKEAFHLAAGKPLRMERKSEPFKHGEYSFYDLNERIYPRPYYWFYFSDVYWSLEMVRLGISSEVLHILQDEGNYSNSYISIPQFEPYSDDDVDLFSDGTIVQLRRQ
jgi:hypothetical protein